MALAARELYVYWKLPRAQAHGALEAVRAFQEDLCTAHPGLQARVVQRADDTGPLATLMEVYTRASAPGGVDAAVQADIEARAAAALTGLDAGPRHVEVFADPGPPA
jgi:hypothetical protein